MRQKINLQTILIILGVLVMCLGVGYLVFVWTERTTVPLGGNVPAPLNVSTAPQVVPSSLSATIISATQINLAWLDNSADETGFEIERCAGADCTAFTLVYTTGANAATWSDTGLAGGTLYRYRVRAINVVGNSAFSNIAEATTLRVPLAPSSLSAGAASDIHIHLSWLDNSAIETGFQIERCTGAGCTAFTLVHTTGANATTWSDTGLVVGTLYRYRVRAINAFAGSTYSNIAEATTLRVPFAPSSLSATAMSASQIHLSWLDNFADETGFEIHRCAGAGCTTFTLLHTIGANTTTWSDTGLFGETVYRYRVRGINLFGKGAFSEIDEIHTTRAAYRLIFVTSTMHSGNLGGLEGGDAICAAQAREAGIGGAFKAWLSSNTVHAQDRLVRSVFPYKRIDRVRVADNFHHLISGRHLLAPINVTERGTLLTRGIGGWTGGLDGTLAIGFTCDSWTSRDMLSLGVFGDVWSKDRHWTGDWAGSCDMLMVLYCLQQ